MSWISSAVALQLLPRRFTARLRRSHPFDKRYETDTEGLLYAADLATGHAADRFNEGYYATAPSLFRGALAAWQETLSEWEVEDYTFFDLGCGKGRVLLLASHAPFRAVRGIELNPKLVRAARRNVRKWLNARGSRRSAPACRSIRVETADVLNVDWASNLPAGPVILFLFNSFAAEVLGPLMQNLAAAARRRNSPIDLIYVHPDHDLLVGRTPGIELLGCVEVPFNEEDAAADVFGVSCDTVSIYRLASAAS